MKTAIAASVIGSRKPRSTSPTKRKVCSTAVSGKQKDSANPEVKSIDIGNELQHFSVLSVADMEDEETMMAAVQLVKPKADSANNDSQPQQSINDDSPQTAEPAIGLVKINQITNCDTPEAVGIETSPDDTAKSKSQATVESLSILNAEVKPIIEKAGMKFTPPTALATSELRKTAAKPQSTAPDQTSMRVHRIMQYLQNSIPTPINAASVTANGTNQQSSASNKPPLLREEISLADLKAKVIAFQVENDEHARTQAILRVELKRVKEMNEEQLKEHQKELKSKLGLQRKEYEDIIKRHLAFIDKIIAEKDDLSKRCEKLAEESKQLEKKFVEKVTLLEETHIKDLKMKRDTWESAEKLKRDKWIQEKTKLIKDQTLKGLEPEIQRLIAQHKTQMKRLEDKHAQNLVDQREQLAEQHQELVEQYRDRIAAERRRAMEEEREFARQRYQKQLERDEMEFQQQKRKLQASFEEQKDRMVQSFKDEMQQKEQSSRKLIDDLKNSLETARLDRQRAMDDLAKKHQLELVQLKESFGLQSEQIKSDTRKMVERDAVEKEKKLREKLIEERDREIEMVIQRLESETYSSSSDIAHRYRLEIERLRSDHAEELKQLREQSNIALDKVLNLQNHLAQKEDEVKTMQKDVLKLQHENMAKETVIKTQKTGLQRLKLDEEALRAEIAKELQDELRDKDQRLLSLQEQVTQYRRREQDLAQQYERQLQDILRRKEEELDSVEGQVRQTLSHRDDTINDLRAQLDEERIKNTQLTLILEKQRQELVGG